ncbi:MAG: efflux RND transporter permease subunit [Porticoccaceae bacterium]|nr:efflux RND transporter permease subunit [Porticoccaceae bacterium]
MQSEKYGLIGWFSKNPVAANLMMILIIGAGLISAMNISKEMFPIGELDRISISAVYPGAAPVEVEKGVILPMESVLQGLKGVKKINSTANRDFASINLEIESNEDIQEVMAQVENRIDSIVNFPDDMEKPSVTRMTMDEARWVMGISVSGNMDERTRKVLGQEMRDELLLLADIKNVILWGVDDYEISIEVDEDRLREFNLTLNEVAQVLRNSSLDLPAGMIRSADGNVLVRTQGKAYTGKDFANMVLRSQPDGTELLLSDVATVRDGFAESSNIVRFDGEDAINLGVFSTEGQDIITISDRIKQYIVEKRETLPEELSINEFFDTSFHLRGRLNMMLENLALGAVLVAIVLGLFLNLHVAGWVMLGIPVSFLGAFWLMPIGPYPVTVNVLSLFAFIMVLGIVVDDAIVIGESIFSQAKKDFKQKLASSSAGSEDSDGGEANEIGYKASVATVIAGAKKVATPSTIGVLTTMAAFAPILFVGGAAAPFFESIAMVVILCLLFSLVESKLILPAHLVGLKLGDRSTSKVAFIERWQTAIGNRLSAFVENTYLPFLRLCLQHRYATLAGFLALLIISISAVNSGIARFEFFPNVPGDGVQAKVTMQDGTSAEILEETLTRIEAAAFEVDAEHRRNYPQDKGLIEHVIFYTESDTQSTFMASLTHAEDRSIDGFEIEKLWRNKVGTLPNVRKQSYFAGTNAGGGAKINLTLSGSDPEQLTLAGAELADKLGEYNGVIDIYNSQGAGGREILISLKPYASQLDISLGDIARQVRQAFYGEEVQRLQRGADTLKVMVRYPIENRRSIATLEDMLIRTSSGQAIAIGEVADIELGLGLTAISRIDRERTVTITADVDAAKAQSGTVIADITGNFIPELLARYPGVKFGLGGASEEQQILMNRMILGFVASLFLIYGLLAVPLKSYVQPLVIMAVIPFGFIGAVVGHIVFDVAISMLSIFGLIALAGVVVNDSLILVEFVNRAREEEQTIDEALASAGKQRFRAILLTTMTTFVGLLPMLFETSTQAQFVIPMALSLSFGIVFATTITLVLVPCLYRVIYDLRESKRFTEPTLAEG